MINMTYASATRLAQGFECPRCSAIVESGNTYWENWTYQLMGVENNHYGQWKTEQCAIDDRR